MKNIVLGISGTRSGLSDIQLEIYKEFLKQVKVVTQIDGMCIGVDSECAAIANEHGIYTIGKPGIFKNNPTNLSNRDNAFRNQVDKENTHFARNRNIVNKCNFLLAFPYKRSNKGGTNYTIDYAIKKNKPLAYVDRLGNIKYHNTTFRIK